MWRKSPEANPSSPSGEPHFPPAASEAKGPAFAVVERPIPPPGVGPNSSWVNQGLRFHGVFSGDSDLYMDGELQGKIRLKQSAVSIGPNGKVQGDIHAREIVVKGTLNGNVQAGAKTVLGRTGRVRGDILGKCVVIEEGAFFQGRVDMEGADEKRSAASDRSAEEDREVQPMATQSREGRAGR